MFNFHLKKIFGDIQLCIDFMENVHTVPLKKLVYPHSGGQNEVSPIGG